MEKQIYEKPSLEIVEVELENSVCTDSGIHNLSVNPGIWSQNGENNYNNSAGSTRWSNF